MPPVLAGKRRSDRLQTGCVFLAVAAFATCLLVSYAGDATRTIQHHGRGRLESYMPLLDRVLSTVPGRGQRNNLACATWFRRSLLGVWDEQHPGPNGRFSWTPRNIIAIAAACVVRRCSYQSTL